MVPCGDLFSNMSWLAYKKDALAIKTGKMIRVLRGVNIGKELHPELVKINLGKLPLANNSNTVLRMVSFKTFHSFPE